MGHYCESLADAFMQAGYEVIFCSIGPARLGSRNLHVPARWRTSRDRVNMLLQYAVMFFRLIREKRGTFIVLNVSQEYIFPFFLRRTVNVIHDAIQIFYPRNSKIKWMLTFNWMLARRSALNIADSQATADDIRQFGIRARVIHVFFNESGYLARGAAERPIVEFAAVWCGTGAVHKNLGLYLELCRLHPRDRFAAVLNRSYVREFEEQNKLPPNLQTFSAITSMQYMDLILSSGMLISTSLKEGYGMPPMEAALLGVPILLSDIPVYRELYGGVAEFFDLNLASLDAEFGKLKGIAVSHPVSPERLARLRNAQGHTRQFVDAIAPLFVDQ